MSASLEMQFKMTKGSDEEFRAVLGVLEVIGGKPLEQLRDLFIGYSGEKSFLIENMFPNIWGDHPLELDLEPYYRFAKAAPNAEWEASSDRLYEGDGSNSWDKASYSNGVLMYQEKEFYDEPEESKFLLREFFIDGKEPDGPDGIFLDEIIEEDD